MNEKVGGGRIGPNREWRNVEKRGFSINGKRGGKEKETSQGGDGQS